MKTTELLKQYISRNKGEYFEPKVGEYHSSSVYAIIKGYLTPAKFFTKKDFDQKGCENILAGELYEEALMRILEHGKIKVDYQAKKKIEIAPGIVIVVKPDFVTDDFILETKYPDSPMHNAIPEKWMYQMEAQYRAFNKPVKLGIFRKHPFISFVDFVPSEARWELIKRVVVDFHNKLLKKYPDKFADELRDEAKRDLEKNLL